MSQNSLENTQKSSNWLLQISSRCKKEDAFKTNLPSKKEEETACDNESNTDLQEDLFKNEAFSPQEVMFFQQGTIFIQSTLGMRIRPSLPKIYSVDSIVEEKEHLKTEENCNKPRKTTVYEKEKVIGLQEKTTGDSNEKLSLCKPMIKDDLDTVSSFALDALESSQCKDKKMFSFDADENEISRVENLFNATPLKIECSDITFSEPFRKTDLFTKKDLNLGLNNAHGKDSTTKTYNLNDFEQSRENNVCQQNYEETFFFPHQISEKMSLAGKSQVVFDEQSVIELFKYPGPCKAKNVPDLYQTDSYNVWPVTAEYIHVSKAKNIGSVNSSSGSESSFSMARKCEKSFFSLQLNKRYEQKQEYVRDLIVQDNPVECCKGESSFSLMNQSYIVYDRDHVILNKTSSQQSLSNQNEKGKRKLKDTVRQNKNSKHILTRQFKDNKHLVENKYFSGEHLDFSKLNEYDVNGNWNSYISIFTSKVGPSSRVNHHQVIQKIINKFGGEPLKENVHTLTSNRGPFRLFDLNGYPLTDCAGNVLKDPYGKVVVDLDSTGLPKDDTRVFDAEGYSPKDFKFDPTKKPKTNSVVIKLTDNFKRPLHLFDKYGRPLTDSNGKLLVNIHGRPLLRFDNFGRPTTDYRGGSLYTDNGFCWTFKNDYDCLSNEHNHSVPFEKQSRALIKGNKELRNDNFEKIISSRNDSGSKTHDYQFPEKSHNISQPTKNTADKWSAIENILQNVLKERKLEQKIPQGSVLVNSVTITKNPLDKAFLDPIIYHNNLEVTNNSFIENTNNFKTKNDNCLKENNADINGISGVRNPASSNYPHLIKNNNSGKVKQFHCNSGHYISKNPTHIPFYRNVLLENECLKCTHQNNGLFQQEYYKGCNSFQKHKDWLMNPQLIRNNQHFLKDLSLPTYSDFYEEFEKKYTSSYFTFKNHDYLNGLSSQTQRYTAPQHNNKTLLKQAILNKGGYKRWTDTSHTYSDVNTTVLTQTDSLTINMQNRKKPSEEKEKLAKEYNNRENRHHFAEEKFGEGRNLDTRNPCNNTMSLKEKYLHDMIESCKDSKSNFSLSKHILSLNILNQRDTHYEIKVADKSQMHSRRNYPTEPLQKLESRKEIKAAVKNDKTNCLDHRKSKQLSSKENNLDEYKPSKNQVKDSPFRFLSNDKLDNNLEVNNKHKKKCQLDPDVNKNNKQEKLIKKHSSDFRSSSLRNVEKRSSKQRECTLVSFLGIPMKYVLKQFDSRKSPKPQNRNKNKRNPATIHQRHKPSNETKIKTLYDGSKLGKQFLSSSNESKPRTKLKCKKDQSQGLLAFKSKSCTDICDFKGIAMSYSGKQKSEIETNLKDLPSTSQELKRTSSLICLSHDSLSACYKRTNRTQKHASQRHREVRHFYETGSSGKTYRHSPERSKDRKQSSGRHKKPIPKTVNPQKREISLFRKVEPSGKYMAKFNT